MGQSPSDREAWVTFRDRGSGREVQAAPKDDGWIVSDGVITRLMAADEFERKYERT
jgi:hypothetical protein